MQLHCRIANTAELWTLEATALLPPRTAMRCRVCLLHPHTRIDGTISTGFDRLFPHCEDAVVQSSHYLHASVLGAHQKRRREDSGRGTGERWPGDVMAMMRLCMYCTCLPCSIPLRSCRQCVGRAALLLLQGSPGTGILPIERTGAKATG